MMACTSPLPTFRSIPFRIGFSATFTCRLLISIIVSVPPVAAALRRPGRRRVVVRERRARASADAALQADADELLRLDRELHRKLLEHFARSEEHTSELQSLMRISYAVFCLKKKKY